MNSFARYLFQALFSWVPEAIRELSNPALLDSWLARNWLAAVIPLLLIGTVADYLVWLLRWRPDLAWRTSMKRSVSMLNEEGRQMRRFRKGFKGENADIGAIARPLAEPQEPDEVPEYEDPQESASISEDAYYDWQFAQTAAPAQPAERHRRSDRYRRKRRLERAPSRRPSLVEEDDTGVNGFPPVVSKEDAFRAPVYPRYPDQDGRS